MRNSNDYRHALDDFLKLDIAAGWRDLPFFANGSAARVLESVAASARAGANILPAPPNIFNALAAVAPEKVRVVILGQDPYPTPGHAHGLAFSYLGEGALPASLRNIFKELASDLGGAPGAKGDLTRWTRQGVLLLNTALTVEAGKAGAHMKFGWRELTREAVQRVSQRAPACVFILWGDKARAYRDLIDDTHHLIIESAHPSPLSARHGFFGSKPFSRANDFLVSSSLQPIQW